MPPPMRECMCVFVFYMCFMCVWLLTLLLFVLLYLYTIIDAFIVFRRHVHSPPPQKNCMGGGVT